MGKARWGDKTPRYVESIPFISGLFPDARFVHLVRDGRDVALSYANVPFGPKTVARAASLWAKRVRKGRVKIVITDRAVPPAPGVVVPVLICGSMDLITIGNMQQGWFVNWLIFHDPFTFEFLDPPAKAQEAGKLSPAEWCTTW